MSCCTYETVKRKLVPDPRRATRGTTTAGKASLKKVAQVTSYIIGQ